MDSPVRETLRIAVTGVAGRIGSAVAKALIARGHKVVGLDRRLPSERFCKFVYCDLRRRDIVQPVFEQCNAVVHLGEIPHLPDNIAPEEVYETNTAVGGTVMQTVAELKVPRFIYTSTCQVYGAWGHQLTAPETMPVVETTRLRPQNAYAASKVANEGYANMIGDREGLSVTAFRLPYVVTDDEPARMRRWFGRESLHHMVDGFGTYVHVKDVITAYIAALEKGENGFQVYHLSGANVRLRMTLHNYLEKVAVGYPKLPADWPDYKSPLVVAKAKAQLGWEPTWDARQYIDLSLNDAE